MNEPLSIFIDTFDVFSVRHASAIKQAYHPLPSVSVDTVRICVLGDDLIFTLQGYYPLHPLALRLQHLTEQLSLKAHPLLTRDDLDGTIAAYPDACYCFYASANKKLLTTLKQAAKARRIAVLGGLKAEKDLYGHIGIGKKRPTLGKSA